MTVGIAMCAMIDQIKQPFMIIINLNHCRLRFWLQKKYSPSVGGVQLLLASPNRCTIQDLIYVSLY